MIPFPVAFYKVGNSFDADAKAFIDAAGITGTLQRNTLNQFVKYLKGEGTTHGSNLFSKITALYPYCPIDDTTATATAYSFNLINPATFQVSWTGFVAGSFLVTGVTGTGGTRYGLTGVIPSEHLQLNNSGLTAYSRTDRADSGVAIGSRTSSTSGNSFLIPRLASNAARGRIHEESNNNDRVNDNSLGLFDVQRSASNLLTIHQNGLQLGANVTTASSTMSNVPITLHMLRTSTSYSNGDAREYAGFAIRESFTADEIADWYFAWNYYQTNIIPGGRNV
jgi:hypothetical protein